MAEPVEGKKPEQRMVPASDLIAFKKSSEGREKKLKGQLEDMTAKVAELAGQVDILGTNTDDDDEVKSVKALLVKRDREVSAKESEHKKREAALTERERVASAKDIVSEYKERGVELDVDALLAEESESAMKEIAMNAWADSLVKKEREEPSESKEVFETGTGGTIRKDPYEMVKSDGSVDKEELAELRKSLMKQPS